MRVLACDGIHDDGLALFRAAGWDVEVSDPIKDPARLAADLADVDALLVRSATPVTAEALANAPRLKVIGRAGVGARHVAREREEQAQRVLGGGQRVAVGGVHHGDAAGSCSASGRARTSRTPT